MENVNSKTPMEKTDYTTKPIHFPNPDQFVITTAPVGILSMDPVQFFANNHKPQVQSKIQAQAPPAPEKSSYLTITTHLESCTSSIY